MKHPHQTLTGPRPEHEMDYFTTDNTFGFTDEQLLHLNEAHALLVEFAVTQRETTPDRAQVEKSVGDTLNDAWRPDCWTSADLVYRVLTRSIARWT